MPKFVVDGDVPINKVRNGDSDTQTEQPQQEQSNDDSAIGHNFYKEIMSLQKSNSFYKRVILFLLLIVTIAVCLIGYVGSMSKTDLAVVHTSGDNQILNVSMASPLNNISSSELSTYFIEQFILNARAISVDQIVNNHMQIKAFAYLQGQAFKAFREYLANNDKASISKDSFIEITIDTVLPNVGGSSNTSQITWTETKRDNSTNEVISTTKYTAQLTFRLDFKSPSNSNIRIYNPLGFYITNITWTKDYNAG